MTMKFEPHIRHVADQQRDEQGDREYTIYEKNLELLEAELRMILPRVPREEFDEMRELLAARRGVAV